MASLDVSIFISIVVLERCIAMLNTGRLSEVQSVHDRSTKALCYANKFEVRTFPRLV